MVFVELSVPLISMASILQVNTFYLHFQTYIYVHLYMYKSYIYCRLHYCNMYCMYVRIYACTYVLLSTGVRRVEIALPAFMEK